MGHPFLFPALLEKGKTLMESATEDLGRGGDVCAEIRTEDLSTLECARRLFADLSRGLEGMIDRLRTAYEAETDIKRINELQEAIRQNQKALQSVLNMEGKLMPGPGKAGRGEGVIDLAQARAEIARRLDRLAR